MSDTERLNLIEHYKWSVRCIEGRWHITIISTIVVKDTLREAVDAALDAQAKWALNRD